MPLTLWEPGRPGRADVAPPRPFRRSQLCNRAGQRYCAGISVRSRLGPNVDGVAGRIQEVSYYHRVTPCGLSNVHEDTPFVAGFLRDGRNVGSVHSGDEDRGFRERPVLHRSVHGLWIRFSTRSAALAWTLIVYAGKGV